MYIHRAKVTNFRNIGYTSLDFSPGLNVFTGENGQGKTNLMEAVFFGSQGNSFRTKDSSCLIQEGFSESAIEIDLTQKNLHYRLKAVLNTKKKDLLKDGKKIFSKNLKKLFSIIEFSPDSLLFVKEGMEWRRNLLDEALMSASSLNVDLIFEHRHILKTRNKILKQFLQRMIERKRAEDLLDALDSVYFKISAELTFRRIELVHSIQRELSNAMHNILGLEKNNIYLEYLNSQIDSKNWNQTDIQFLMMQRALELRDQELSSGTSLVGPHRHSVKFLFNGKDSRFFCSQGQQRAIILSFKMAQIVYHRKANETYPVLMLDDVLSELDSLKQRALVNFLHDLNTQIFLTTTDFQLLKSFNLDNVKVVQMNNGKGIIQI